MINVIRAAIDGGLLFTAAGDQSAGALLATLIKNLREKNTARSGMWRRETYIVQNLMARYGNHTHVTWST